MAKQIAARCLLLTFTGLYVSPDIPAYFIVVLRIKQTDVRLPYANVFQCNFAEYLDAFTNYVYFKRELETFIYPL